MQTILKMLFVLEYTGWYMLIKTRTKHTIITLQECERFLYLAHKVFI